MPKQEIFCRICRKWCDYLGGAVLPPDVITEKSGCGHNLPVTARVREVAEPDAPVAPAPEPVPAPPAPQPPAPDPENDPIAWESEESSWEHSAN